MVSLTLYINPFDAPSTLTHDSGWSVNGVVVNDPNGRTCQVFHIPEGTPDKWGCRLHVEAEEKVPFDVRGLLVRLYGPGDGSWLYFLDDITLVDMPEAPPVPIPVPPQPSPTPTTPIGIINAVYQTGLYDLSTKEGCGEFTEKCCDELHAKLTPSWGHVRKTGAQNQYNGHAVDAIQVLVRDNETKPGIYDIITSSESHDAKPAFNFAGDARPDLWYYPA